MKILIVGAGTAGLAIGWRLREAGADVEILERGRAGRGASWAAAGMLAPGAELRSEAGALTRLAQDSRQAWPDFATQLEAASGCDIAFRQDGSLNVAETEARAAALEDLAMKLRGEGMDAAWLSAEELRAREALLSPALLGALYVASDAHVDNRALGVALVAALKRSRGALREQCEVRSLIVESNRIRGVVTSEGTLEGDVVVLASGAWLNRMGGVGASDLPLVSPAKGQMVALEPPLGTPFPQTLIWNEEVYLVPRRDRLFAGATMEDAGFDTSVTREARDQLMRATRRLIPEAQNWRLAEMWAGLRPHTPDGVPVLGETRISGLYVAGGQFRNGVLFAPVIADAMRRIVLREPPRVDVSTFSPKRFGP